MAENTNSTDTTGATIGSPLTMTELPAPKLGGDLLRARSHLLDTDTDGGGDRGCE